LKVSTNVKISSNVLKISEGGHFAFLPNMVHKSFRGCDPAWKTISWRLRDLYVSKTYWRQEAEA